MDRHLKMLYSNHENSKNVNPKRIIEICQWSLNHSKFLDWRQSQCSRLLWLSAGPGCGKSVLAKYLVDTREETLTVNLEPPIVCYFFFKDGDLDRTNGAKALCAILHQLFVQASRLYRYASDDFNKKGEKLLQDFDALWEILSAASKNASINKLIYVLNALDECSRNSEKLISKIVNLFNSSMPNNQTAPMVKFLVTSSEYDIVRKFRTLTNVRLPDDEKLSLINQEINLVIDYKVKELRVKMGLSKSEGLGLQMKLKAVLQRIYLWLYLIFQFIEQRLEFSEHEITTITSIISQSVDEAYTKIFDKNPNKERARRLLQIILAAIRPLSLQEINVVMVIDKKINSRSLILGAPNCCREDQEYLRVVRNHCEL